MVVGEEAVKAQEKQLEASKYQFPWKVSLKSANGSPILACIGVLVIGNFIKMLNCVP